MLRYLGMIATQQLNLFISEYLSLHVIIGKRNIDYNKHCQCMFGAFVQANQENDPTNTQAPRMTNAIYLCPTNNIQGGHELMNITT